MGYRDNYFKNNKSNYGWYTCVSCGRKFRKGDIDIDHILPQSCGGSDDIDNLQCMCRHCNRSKRDDTKYTLEDYAGNLTGVRLGDRGVIDTLDEAADKRKKKKLW
ncbi:MAG: HNH endonuclease signature motif containing protein [Clostridia bacterium]|nr:HNH endonuclease signature motif containing protein [Clostridia bacterium]